MIYTKIFQLVRIKHFFSVSLFPTVSSTQSPRLAIYAEISDPARVCVHVDTQQLRTGDTLALNLYNNFI